MWIVFAFLSAISAAFVAIFGKLGIQNIDTTIATTIRSLVMTVFLVSTSLLLGKWGNFSVNSLSKKDWLFIVLSGLAGAISWLFYFLALKMGKATNVAVIDRLSVVFVIILAAVFLGETLTWKTAIGALLMVSGAALVVF